MLPRRTCLAALLALPLALHAQAERPLSVAGVQFARSVQVGGRWLRLNGAGVRAVAWVKGFAAALYLAERASTAAQALAVPGPKRLQLRMLQRVPAEEFVKALRKGVERNAPPAEMARLAEGLAQFEAQIRSLGTVRVGDVVDLDLDPARGLMFSRNGAAVGQPVAGGDVFGALLRSFVGEHPYDRQLRAGLLGR